MLLVGFVAWIFGFGRFWLPWEGCWAADSHTETDVKGKQKDRMSRGGEHHLWNPKVRGEKLKGVRSTRAIANMMPNAKEGKIIGVSFSILRFYKIDWAVVTMATSAWKICLMNLFLDEWTSWMISVCRLSRFFSRNPGGERKERTERQQGHNESLTSEMSYWQRVSYSSRVLLMKFELVPVLIFACSAITTISSCLPLSSSSIYSR